MEDEGNLLSRMRKIFSGEMEEGEDAAGCDGYGR